MQTLAHGRLCSGRNAAIFRLIAAGALALCLPALFAARENTTRSPNVILIMADDMGYGDPGCFNAESKNPTPHIDRLAKEGMRFTNAHSPSGICVLTVFAALKADIERGR